MTYFPIVLNADRRVRSGLANLRLQNWYAEPLPAEANKPVKAALVPPPGRQARVDLGAPIAGVFAENGVQGGALFAVAGSAVYRINADWTATALGNIGGTGDVVFDGLRENLYLSRGEKPWRWNGTALTQVSDIDAPEISSFVVLAQRILAVEEASDTLFWSATLDGTAWEALGFATAEQRPDIVRAIVRVSGQALVLGGSSIEIHRATGSSTLPFANVTAQAIEETDGVLSKYSWARRGDKVFLIGGNRKPYIVNGFALTPLPGNGELNDELAALSAADLALVTCWAMSDGDREFFFVRPPGKPAKVFDTSTGLWHSRKSWGADTYLPRYYARAYGKDVIADEGGSVLYTLERDRYDDAGAVVERVATLRLAVAQPQAIGSMCVDLQAVGRPLTGQGSSPRLMIDISGDGRTDRDDTRSEEVIEIGPDGTYLKPTLWGLGDFTPGEGATITLKLTDSIGLSLYGAWFDEGQR